MSEFLFLNSIKMKRSKSLILTSLYHLKFFDILRRFQKNRVLILMYHRFSDKPEPFKISQQVFENQIKFLKKRYNFISLNHYSEFLTGVRDDFPDNPIILTIDDGHWDNYTFAYPILKKYSVPAALFISTNFITNKAWLCSDILQYILGTTKFREFYFPLGDKTVQFRLDNFQDWLKSQLRIFNYCRTISEHEKDELINQLAKHLTVNLPDQTAGDFQPLTWDQVREMHDNGIEFGSHTCSHPILSTLTSEDLNHEILDSKREMETRLGVEISSFSYPNGQPEDINDIVIQMTQKAGYSCAVTTMKGFNDTRNTNPFLLKRMSILTNNKTYLLREITG